MRHHRAGRKFGRSQKQRRALLTHLAVAFFEHGKILTTEAKAKEIQPIIEACITKTREGTRENRRELLRRFPRRTALKIIREVAPRYHGRNGGYTRVIKVERRKSDGAPRAILQFV